MILWAALDPEGVTAISPLRRTSAYDPNGVADHLNVCGYRRRTRVDRMDQET